MKITAIEELASGSLRPRRLYSKDYVASACGRMLLRVGSGGTQGALWTPFGLVATDASLVLDANRRGIACYQVDALTAEAVARLEETLDGMAAKSRIVRMVAWMRGN